VVPCEGLGLSYQVFVFSSPKQVMTMPASQSFCEAHLGEAAKNDFLVVKS
jgi:hypothetical protein